MRASAFVPESRSNVVCMLSIKRALFTSAFIFEKEVTDTSTKGFTILRKGLRVRNKNSLNK